MEKFPFLSEVFDSINEGIYILNRQGDYIYCNSAFLKMVGATRDDALGLNAFRLVPEGQVSISVAVMAFEQKKKLSVINNVCTPKGYHYRQLATATPIFDSVGEIEYMLVEMVRLDLFKKRYQQAILDEDADCIEVPGLGEALADRPETFVAESQSMRALLDMAKQVAGVDSTILISGETGTGKEVLANFIHRHSHRADRPMVEINCAALPENLLEAELFGYEKGAFTGALNTGKPGMVEEANGGTLFLDEINSMDPALQAKLLKVLEEKKVRRLGGSRDIPFDVRIVAAVNEKPQKLIREGRLREDLYYRLGVIRLTLPPLRERLCDIGPLADYFIEHYNRKLHRRVRGLSERALRLLRGYAWPGNVRELKNAIEGAVAVARGERLTVEDMEEILAGRLGGLNRPPELPEALRLEESFSLTRALDSYERELLSRAMQQAGSISQAARLLGLSRQNLKYKLKKFDL